MASLTSFIPILCPDLHMTRDALYERQRALVRIGVLPQPEGRGKGSGAEARPETIAALLIAVLLTDSLSGIDDRVRKLAGGQFDDQLEKACRLTAAPTFGQALTRILGSEQLAERVWSVKVDRINLEAAISFGLRVRSRNPQISFFGRPISSKHYGLEVRAELTGKFLTRVAHELRALDVGEKS